jgi:hypothetical protein
MARPSKLTPEIATGIVTLLENAVHPEVAAGAYGVSLTTFYEWIRRGEGREDGDRLMDPMYVEFAQKVTEAEYKAESALVGLAIGKIKTTADAVLLLERRFRDRWQRTEEVTINLRREAEKIAEATGLNASEIQAEAERILAEARW